MSAIGWWASGTLFSKAVAQSGSVPEFLEYSVLAVAVCAICTALLIIAELQKAPATRPAFDRGEVSQAERLRLAAAQTGFRESRLRLLALADRVEARRHAL